MEFIELGHSVEDKYEKGTIKIAKVNFAYNNAWAINKLRERGDAIKL